MSAPAAQGDFFMYLADLRSYATTQAKVGAVYADQAEWARKAILNVASSGRFSSDRAISEYAAQIWDAKPCPVPGEALTEASSARVQRA